MTNYNRLIVYACSFGWSGAVNPYIPWYLDNSFPDLLSRKLNLQLDNRSMPGTNPESQFHSILYDIEQNKILETDFVIIQWTHVDRIFSDRWGSLMPHIDDQNIRWYYEHVYNISYSVNKLLSYINTLETILPNLHHNFADGIKYIRDHGSSVLVNKLENIKYIGFSEKSIVHHLWDIAGDNKKFNYPCCHPTKEGHDLIASLYHQEILSKYYYDKNCNF